MFFLGTSQGYLHIALIETTSVPIVKNKSGNLSDSNNYRPIALATIVSNGNMLNKTYDASVAPKNKTYRKIQVVKHGIQC